MTAPALPPEIRVETEGFDVTYSLPRRPIGNLRWAGLFLVVFGALFSLGPAGLQFGFLNHILSGSVGPREWIFAIFLLPFAIAGLIPAVIGLLIMFGSCRVEWKEKQLSTVEIVGPLRWRRKLSKEKSLIRKFSIGFGAKNNGKPVTSGPLATLGTLVAETDQGKPRIVAIGYPSEWLQALAQDLSARVGAFSSSALAPRVEVVDANNPVLQENEAPKRPIDSQVNIESTLTGLKLTIPPIGLGKGKLRGLFGLGVFWCLFMTVFSGFFVLGSIKGSAIPWPVWLFLLVFWAIGIGMLTGAINLGRRHALLRVENGRLEIIQTGLFGKKQWLWDAKDIASIRADNSGMEVNHRPILNLQIHPVRGRKAGFFAGRNEDELRWMAAELRRALRLP